MSEMQWYPAPGKLNLLLHVLGRRDDGYHQLQTVFRLIERGDRVGIALRADGAVQRTDSLPGVSAEDDLCLRAAKRLKRYAQTRLGPAPRSLGADIGLEKVLPIGGGLGGGSSDAATLLLVLNRAWGLDLARAELLGLAAEIGADVPFFVYGENALGEGIGERLRALALPAAWYLVLVPQVTVSTKEIFADAKLTRNSKPLTIPPFFAGLGRNDLESVVTARSPEVAAHLEWLKQRCPNARMTGSGACVFAEFSTEAEARAIHSQLPESMRAFVTRGLERHPLHGWAN